jgi:hypothetical protein
LWQRFVYKREKKYLVKIKRGKEGGKRGKEGGKRGERKGKEGGKRGERRGKDWGKREGGETERFVLD